MKHYINGMTNKVDTINSIKDTKRMKPYLKQAWCECEQPEFLCYPEDGCCTCGEYKHHVHCTCGSISQTG